MESPPVNAQDPGVWDHYMERALGLASDPRAPRGENPRVGCVILDARGEVAAEGWHEGAGTAHAEVMALRSAGERARGGTAVVTLEPCRHQGRTGPCTQALIDAGVSRVVFAQSDPSANAGGGARELQAAGMEVVGGVLESQAWEINREWTIATARGLPFVTAKCAISLDGRVAGPGGEPVQLTGVQANEFSHGLRARVQAVLVGTGTVRTDDPQLTVRHVPVPVSGQPLRVVVGRSPLPSQARILDSSAPTLQIHDHDPTSVLGQLYERGVRHVLVEGGPTVLRAFIEAGVVDELVWLIAGVWVGSGPRALPPGEPLGKVATVVDTATLGQDVLVRMSFSQDSVANAIA